MILQEEREQVAEYGRKMVELGITVGTFGNISIYNPDKKLMALSPSGMDYMLINPQDVVVLTPDGQKVDGDRKPSSEYDMHRIFYQKRQGINSVIHTHSLYATTLACMHRSIEPIHYEIAYAGSDVPCTPYVPFGTYELAQAAFNAIGPDRNACLLGNHGLLAVGSKINYTLDVAQQVEFVAHLYYNTLIAGGGINLSDKELKSVLGAFQTYRQK